MPEHDVLEGAEGRQQLKGLKHEAHLLAPQRGAGVLVSTHYMDEAVQADRLVVMARGRVVATGSEADVVGERRTLVVEAAHWEGAFAAVDGAGLRPLLAGRTIRVPGGEDDLPTLRQVLADAGVEADVRTAPATLEETLVELSR